MKKSGSILNYLLIKTDDGVAIQKREGNGIWKGLYQLPMVPGDLSPDEIAAECLVTYGVQPLKMREIRRVKHILTHTQLDIRFYSVKTKPGLPDTTLFMVPEIEIKGYPFPKPLVDFLADPEVE